MADPPAIPLTTLTAVNELLRAAGLREVSAFADTTDSFNAYRAISTQNTLVQSKGWFCNSSENLTFVRNAGPSPPINTVSVAAQYLLVRPKRGGNVWPKYLTVRGGLLYDMTTNTNVFTVDPELNIVEALDFADLPPALRWLVVCEAGVTFMPATYPTPESYFFTERVLENAKAAAAHEDEILRDGALQETSPHFRGMRQR